MMRTLPILLIFLFVSCIPAIAKEPFLRDYALNEQNVPVPVNDILQDSDGYLWVATDQGLYRFNGERFLKIPDSLHSPVMCLALLNGELYAGFKDGRLGRIDNFFKGIFRFLDQNAGSPILDILPDSSGKSLWLGTEAGVFSYDDSLRVFLDGASGLSDDFIYTLNQISGNRFLVGTDNGINDVLLNGRKPIVKRIATAEGLPDNIVRVIRRMRGTDLFWIGMQQGGIALYDAGTRMINNFSGIGAWPYGQVNDILPMGSGHAWIATQNGYLIDARWSNSRSFNTNVFHFPDKSFQKLVCDKSGNIWCASQKGLSMLTAEYLNKIILPSPYSLQKVTAITCDLNGNVWIAQNKDLYRLSITAGVRGLEWVYRAPAPISCLFNDRSNRLWIGTMGNGLSYRTMQGDMIHADGLQAVEQGSILSITGTPDRLWLSALTGVYELSYPVPDKAELRLIKHHNSQSGIGTDYVYFLFPDRKGQIWMATDGAGVCMLSATGYHNWKKINGEDGSVSYSITEDSRGNIWAGTYYKGLYFFDHTGWKAMKHDDASDANISAVTANASGQVLAVYDRCIDEWYPGSRQFRHFNYRLGLDIDSTSGVLNCVAKDTLGNVLIPFEHGLLIFKNQDQVYDIRPGVHITEISVLLKPLLQQKKEFKYDENYFSFGFEGINFTNPERLSYRYKLVGYGDEWIPTQDESVTFPNLPPGDYVFRVQAALDGIFDRVNEDTFSFTVKAPLWQRPWFMIVTGLLLLCIIYFLVKLREKRQQEFTQLEQERMNFEYEHLKSQVNPHFLFNSLNTLTNLIEEDAGAAVTYTERLSDLYKNILAYRNRDLIALREDRNILSSYLFVQRSRFGAALQVEFDVSEALLNKKIVPMCLQMLVENAVKHNIVSITQPLCIKIGSVNNEIIVSNPLQPKLSKEKGAGLGLINISNRYKLLTKRAVIFGIEKNEFVVRVPLL
jgi:ligand-binding sensor domain-containing protein